MTLPPALPPIPPHSLPTQAYARRRCSPWCPVSTEATAACLRWAGPGPDPSRRPSSSRPPSCAPLRASSDPHPLARSRSITLCLSRRRPHALPRRVARCWYRASHAHRCRLKPPLRHWLSGANSAYYDEPRTYLHHRTFALTFPGEPRRACQAMLRALVMQIRIRSKSPRRLLCGCPRKASLVEVLVLCSGFNRHNTGALLVCCVLSAMRTDGTGCIAL